MDTGQDRLWDLEDEEDICCTIAFSFVLLAVFEFSSISLHSLCLLKMPWAKRGVLTKGLSLQAIKTKACTRLSGLGTESISPLTSDLVRRLFLHQP
jgi:hypothetical protein